VRPPGALRVVGENGPSFGCTAPTESRAGEDRSRKSSARDRPRLERDSHFSSDKRPDDLHPWIASNPASHRGPPWCRRGLRRAPGIRGQRAGRLHDGGEFQFLGASNRPLGVDLRSAGRVQGERHLKKASPSFRGVDQQAISGGRRRVRGEPSPASGGPCPSRRGRGEKPFPLPPP